MERPEERPVLRRGSQPVVVELFVVVAGILIALMVDAAWGARAARAEEQEALRALQADLRESLALLEDRWLPLHDEVSRAAGRILWLLQTDGSEPFPLDDETIGLQEFADRFVIPVSVMREGTWSVTVPDSLLGKVLVTPTFDPTLPSVTALTASGRVGVIRSPDIQSALSAFRAAFIDAQEEERVAREQVMGDLRPRLEEATSIVSAELLGAMWIETPDEWPAELDRSERPVRASMGLVNAFATRANLSLAALGSLQNVGAIMEELLGWIERELR